MPMLRPLCLTAAMLFFAMQPAGADGWVSLSSSQGALSVPVVSFQSRKFQTVVRQQYDFSCGSAAVATLLTYHFGRPTTEREAFDAMFRLGDVERIKREGFSLYEMQLFLQALGYRADGFRVGLDKVARVGVPVIVMIEFKGYKHFVVIKGIKDGWVLVGDPALGIRKWRVGEFKDLWANDIVFVIHNADEIGRRHFNAKVDWSAVPSAVFGDALDRDALASFSVMLPSFREFY